MSESKWILAATADSLVRVELKDDGTVGAARTFLRRGGSVGEALRPVLETLPKRAGAWVWLADAWCQTVALDAEAAAAGRWAYEAEPFSGLRAAESVAVAETAAASGGAVACRIFQAPRRDAESAAAACRSAKCRLLGVGHPGQLGALTGADGGVAEAAGFAPEDAEALAMEWWERAREGRLPPVWMPGRGGGTAAGGGAGRSRAWLAAAGAVALAAVAAAGLASKWQAEGLAEGNESLRTLEAEARRAEAQVQALRNEEAGLVAAREAGLAPRRALQAMRGRTAALYGVIEAFASGAGGREEEKSPAAGAPGKRKGRVVARSILSPEPFAHEVEWWGDGPETVDAALQALAEAVGPRGLAVSPLEAGWNEGVRFWRVRFRVAPAEGASAGEEAR